MACRRPSEWVGRSSGAALAMLLVAPAGAHAQTLTGTAFLETRLFPQRSLNEDLSGQNLSGALEPEWYLESEDRSQSLTIVPFVRLDQHDPERTHWDIRELTWEHVSRSWELRAGVDVVFWGVTESNHLVNVINQTDLVEDIDGESKLGQPMLNLALVRSWGTVDLFALFGFRERTFFGGTGRPRLPRPLAVDRAVVQGGQMDWAARWSHSAGPFDVGVSHFHGTSRDPRFVPLDGSSVLAPLYEPIDQTGLDLQVTNGGWLWKLEAITRAGQGRRFAAVTGGFELTFANLGGRGPDLGLLAEYSFDGRGRDGLTPLDDDVFLGVRLALNDVQSTGVLAGATTDRTSGATIVMVEASRRFGERWTLDLTFRGFAGVPPTDWALFGVRRDDYAQVSWNWHL